MECRSILEGGTPSQAPGAAAPVAPSLEMFDAFERLAQGRENEPPPLIPDDDVLNAMDFTDLTILALQCKLPGNYVRDEVSAREGLRKHRDGAAASESAEGVSEY
eukprot:gene12706-biopygen12909